MGEKKFREIVVRAAVKLPPISTSQPERAYSFLEFLREWVTGQVSRHIRETDNLPHLFAWQDALEELDARLSLREGVGAQPVPPEALPAPTPPRAPAPPGDPREMSAFESTVAAHGRAVQEHAAEEAERQKAYAAAVGDWRKRADAAAVDERIYLPDAAFAAGRESAKRTLDEASTPRQNGMVGVDARYEAKILRHFHALATSRAVDERDVPRAEKIADAVPN
jgi:hypothetical protein